MIWKPANRRQGGSSAFWAGPVFGPTWISSRRHRSPSRPRFREFYDPKNGATAAGTLGHLPHYPVVTVRRLASRLAVTVPQAGQAVDQFVAAGILTERTGHARNRIFAAREVLDILNRPFGAAPLPAEGADSGPPQRNSRPGHAPPKSGSGVFRGPADRRKPHPFPDD